jgi:hypothetical protein
MSRYGISTRVGFTLAPEAIELPPDFDAKQFKQATRTFLSAISLFFHSFTVFTISRPAFRSLYIQSKY